MLCYNLMYNNILIFMEKEMDTIELIEHEIKTLPQFKAQEVLDFILFLKTREMFQKKDKEQKKNPFQIMTHIVKTLKV